jgi:hypothetical protein
MPQKWPLAAFLGHRAGRTPPMLLARALTDLGAPVGFDCAARRRRNERPCQRVRPSPGAPSAPALWSAF